MKKFFYKFVAYFRSLYVTYLLKRTAKLVARAEKAERQMLVRLQGDPRYYQYFADYTYRQISKATAATTEMLPLVGKDPNYVPPPPPPPAPYKPVNVDESKAAWIVDLKERPTRMAAMNTGDSWVKNPVNNPVYQSRLALIAKKKADAEEKLKKAEEAEAAAKEEFLQVVSEDKPKD